MDDFNVSCLYESKNEWGARLVNLLAPCVIEGYRSIFEEAVKLCRESQEMDKYLITFQNLIQRVPKWNPSIIEAERNRIVEKSGCSYLEDLVTCVHILQLKILTSIRVSQKQKKIDINIPKLDDFIHKVYIFTARKLYKYVFLFEVGIPPLQIQKNNREMEMIVNECILNALRDSIPVDTILKVYMDEEDVVEEVKEEIIPVEKETTANTDLNDVPASADADVDVVSEETPNVEKVDESPSKPLLTFNDIDFAKGANNVEEEVVAPKTIERLEEISDIRYAQRKSELEEDDEDDEENEKLHIGDTIDSNSLQHDELPDLMNDFDE
jgi:hypothetical protein